MSDGTTTQDGGQWFAGLDAEHVGHIQIKGWDKMDAPTAAVEMARAHRQAERFIGAPTDQLLRLPKDATDSDGWRQVYQRLGAPADPKDYAFEGVQVGDATASLTDAIRGAAAGANMTKPMAAAVAKSVADWVNNQTESYKTEVAANVQAADEAVKKSWGPNYEAHNYVANRGQEALAARLGERLAPQLEGAMTLLKEGGFGELAAQMKYVVGVGLGEDKTSSVAGGAGGAPSGAMNYDMALARKAELLADQAWGVRYSSGGTDERREMSRLNLIIASKE